MIKRDRLLGILCALFFGFLGGVAASWFFRPAQIVSAESYQDVVYAHKFVVLDRDNKETASFAYDKEGESFLYGDGVGLYSKNDGVNYGVQLSEDGLLISRRTGSAGIGMWRSYPEIYLKDTNGKKVWSAK